MEPTEPGPSKIEKPILERGQGRGGGTPILRRGTRFIGTLLFDHSTARLGGGRGGSVGSIVRAPLPKMFWREFWYGRD